jgi:Rieske Fe-S protein
VFLKRTKEQPDRIIAFNVICPHLACSVEIASGGSFRCPCHNSSFDAAGVRLPGCVSPRDLDALDTRIAAAPTAPGSDPLTGPTIRVKFQNFQSGTHEKIPTT